MKKLIKAALLAGIVAQWQSKIKPELSGYKRTNGRHAGFICKSDLVKQNIMYSCFAIKSAPGTVVAQPHGSCDKHSNNQALAWLLKE